MGPALPHEPSAIDLYGGICPLHLRKTLRRICQLDPGAAGNYTCEILKFRVLRMQQPGSIWLRQSPQLIQTCSQPPSAGDRPPSTPGSLTFMGLVTGLESFSGVSRVLRRRVGLTHAPKLLEETCDAAPRQTSRNSLDCMGYLHPGRECCMGQGPVRE